MDIQFIASLPQPSIRSFGLSPPLFSSGTQATGPVQATDTDTVALFSARVIFLQPTPRSTVETTVLPLSLRDAPGHQSIV